jgi:membrane-bound metal-dependent hydrolase YbcI (DUF457 family)
MFIGHFGVGFGAKKAAPGVSLGVLFIAAQFIDLLWPILLLLGIEHVLISPGITKTTPLDFIDYPVSHSLLFVVIWSLIVGAIYFLIRKNFKYAVILALCVISHWLLDLIVHRPDLPLYPGDSPVFGFGIWNNMLLTFIIEVGIFITGIILYVRTTSPANKIGKYGLWILIALLSIIYVMNLFGPPPPDVNMIAWAGNLQWLFVLLAFWVDKNRSVVKVTDQPALSIK